MRRKVFFICLLMASGALTDAQNLSKMFSCDFYAARQEYADSLAVVADSLKPAYREALRLAENGISLSEYCFTPVVVARQKFSRNDFFLYYPLPDKAWHEAEDGNGYKTIVYRPGADTSCIRINRADSLNRFSITCGQERFFCSSGLYGIGNYDIYMQRKNSRTGKWSEAQNIGFPYNSSYDDFLFINTEDGKYSIFASNRGCGADSVWVFVTNFEAVPIRKPVSDPAQLRRIAELTPWKETKTAKSTSETVDENTRLYRSKLEKVAELRAEVETESNNLEKLRDNYADAVSSERQVLASKLLEGERKLNTARFALIKASDEVAALEMKFTKEGVRIKQGSVSEIGTKEKPAPKTDTDFKFTRHSLGEKLRIEWK